MADDNITGCKKFKFNGIEQTNEEWFCGLPTEEKAKVLRRKTYGNGEDNEREEQGWVNWLKAKHKDQGGVYPRYQLWFFPFQGKGKIFFLLGNECIYQIFSTYLLAFSRAIAEVGAVSMVGGAIAWKTNVMTTAIMQYTNRGNFSLGIALGMILMTLFCLEIWEKQLKL